MAASLSNAFAWPRLLRSSASISTRLLLPLLTNLLARTAGLNFVAGITPSSVAAAFGLALAAFGVSMLYVSRETDASPLGALVSESEETPIPLRARLPLFNRRRDRTRRAQLSLCALVDDGPSAFIGALVATVVLLAIGFTAFRFLLRWTTQAFSGKSPALRMIERHIRRRPFEAFIVFLSFGVGSLLLAFVPQLQATFLTELDGRVDGPPPALFLFDIQAEQLAPLQAFFAGEQIALDGLSPMIRARLSTINGSANARDDTREGYTTREEEEEARTRNRGYNLTFRPRIGNTEKIVEGRDVNGSYGGTGPAEMTLEVEFAKRLGIHVGDHLKFDVQSVPVESVVVGFRRVKWTSFRPNFFVQFQPGVLDEAPTTYLAAVPPLDDPNRALVLQSRLLHDFPNVSVLTVGPLIEKLEKTFHQMGMAVRVTAWVTLLTGAFVFLSVFRGQARSRRGELQLLKVVGADESTLRRLFAGEFILLATASVGLGTIGALVLNQVVARIVFHRAGEIPFVALGELVGGILAGLSIAVLIGAERAVRVKSASLFHSIE